MVRLLGGPVCACVRGVSPNEEQCVVQCMQVEDAAGTLTRVSGVKVLDLDS